MRTRLLKKFILFFFYCFFFICSLISFFPVHSPMHLDKNKQKPENVNSPIEIKCYAMEGNRQIFFLCLQWFSLYCCHKTVLLKQIQIQITGKKPAHFAICNIQICFSIHGHMSFTLLFLTIVEYIYIYKIVRHSTDSLQIPLC